MYRGKAPQAVGPTAPMPARPVRSARLPGTNSSSAFRHTPYCQHGNVIILPKGLRRLCNCLGRVGGKGCRALKAEEPAGLIPGLDYAIGDECKLVAGSELKSGFSENHSPNTPTGE